MADLKLSAVATLTDKISAPLKNIGNSLKNVTASAKGLSKSVTGLTAAAGGAIAFNKAGRGLLSSLAGVTQVAINFEEQMSAVEAVSGATAKQMAVLTAQAKELGKTTRFSALEVAGAQEFLARAGFDPSQIKQALPPLLDLATASKTAIDVTADIASNIQGGFGLLAKDLPMVADVLTAATSRFNTDLRQLGEAMKVAAPVAKDFGLTINETAGFVGLLSNAGIQGSLAGTALRGVMSRLKAPTGKAAEAIKTLNVETRDLEGNLLPLDDILGDILKGTKNLDKASSDLALKEIFGQEVSSAISVLLNEEGTGGVLKALEAMKDVSGIGAKTAAIMNDNTAALQAADKAAGEGLAIALGSILLPITNKLLKTGIKIKGMLSSFITAFPTLSKVLIVVAGAVGVLMVAISALIPVLIVASVVSLPMIIVGLKVVAVMAAIAIAVAVVVLVWKNFGAIMSWVGGVLLSIGKAIWSVLKWVTPLGLAIQVVMAVFENWGAIMDWLGEKWTAFLEGLTKGWEIIKGVLAPLKSIGRFFGGGSTDINIGKEVQQEVQRETLATVTAQQERQRIQENIQNQPQTPPEGKIQVEILGAGTVTSVEATGMDLEAGA